MNNRIVLLVIADSSNTGAPRQVRYLAHGLISHYQVHLLCPGGWLADQAAHDGVHVHMFNNERGRRAIVSDIEQVYATIQPDVIHCHGVRAGILARLARHAKAQMVYTEHLWTNDFHLQSTLREYVQIRTLRFLSGRTDATIAVSQAVRDFLIAKRVAPKDKVTVIPGGIVPIRSMQPISVPVIGTIGYLTWVKGVDTLLRALPLVAKQVPDLQCKIAGDGPDRLALQELALMMGVEDRVQWLGEVADADAFYTSLQLYVQSSKSESFGMAPLEAMSAGVPVVVSDAGALPEIVIDGENGLTFPAGDAKVLAERLIRLLSDPTARGTIAAAGRARAQEFSVEKMITAHRQLYESLV